MRRPNAVLWYLLVLVGTVLTAALTWPLATAPFRFGPLHLDDLAVSAAAATAPLLVMELIKPLWRISFRS